MIGIGSVSAGIKRPWVTALVVALLLAAVLANVLAYAHARSMLHFVSEGQRTKPPEELAWHEKLRVLVVGIDLPHPTNDRSPGDLSLSHAVHRFSTADGLELEGWWIPCASARAVVVLFHGYASTKSALLEEAKAFHDLGFACFLVDHRGHGGSAGDETSIGYREAEDVTAAVDFVCNHLDQTSPTVLYGQSMGGVSIFRALSIRRVDPEAVVVEAIYDETLNAIGNRFHAMGLPSFPGAELLCLWGGAQMGFSARRHNPVEYARAIQVPVLMLQGTEDVRATPEQARRVFAELSGKKTLVAFPGSGHESLYRRAPALWKSEVGAFLASVFGEGARRD